MGIIFKNPLDREITRLERELDYCKTDAQRRTVMRKLSTAYRLRSERDEGKTRVTGDGILRCVTIVGIAAIGFVAETFGSIIPRWAQNKP